MSIDPRRLLGLAFASADLLVEIRDGKICMALGAAQRIVGQSEAALTGKVWRDLFAPCDQPLMDAIFACADDGARRGPVVARLAGPTERHVSVVMRALPENGGRLSCALTSSQAPSPTVGPEGLHPRDSFEDIARGLFEAARVTGIELELAMIEFAGLGDRRAALPRAEAEVLDAQVAGAVRAESHGGAAATRLSDDRFAVLRAKDENTENLTRRLSHMLQLDATAHVVPLDVGTASARAMRALRYALDDFLPVDLQVFQAAGKGPVDARLVEWVPDDPGHRAIPAGRIAGLVVFRPDRGAFAPAGQDGLFPGFGQGAPRDRQRRDASVHDLTSCASPAF